MQLHGEIDEILGPYAIVLESPHLFCDPIHVVTLNGRALAFRPGDDVKVSGVLRRMERGELEERYPISLSETAEYRLGGAAVLVAERLERWEP